MSATPLTGLWVVAAGALALAACGTGTASNDGVETDTFVATYVELRLATLRAGVDAIPHADRDQILSDHGVSEDDLLQFVELHGRDPQFMASVWDTIQGLIDEARVIPTAVDSSGATAPASN